MKSIPGMDDLQQELWAAGKKLVVVEFCTDWCGPCRCMAAFIDKMVPDYPTVIFLKCNIEEVPAAAMTYDVTSMPTVCFFKNGKVADKIIGNKGDQIKAAVMKLK